MYCVYIIYSEKLKRHYIGTTDNFDFRLNQHNAGIYSDAFTKRGVPWSKFFLFEGLESEQAYQIEKYLKKMKSKKYIQNLVRYPELSRKIIEMYK